MKKSGFPVGFWNYQRCGSVGLKDVEYWDECGMTLTMSPSYTEGKDSKDDMLAILDECERRGIKLIICDSRTIWTNAASDPDGYRKRFSAAYADFGHHPATYGFHIGDEPFRENSDNVASAYRIQMEIAPELTPFVNFLPFWEGEYVGYESFHEWADDLIPRAGLKLLCYDRYTQQNPEPDGTNDYFYDLRNHMEYANKYNIPLWTTLLSVGHFRYQPPTLQDFQWQLNTAVASGCKGILWFMFYLRAPHSNYRFAPIDMFGERTKTYYDLQYALKLFHSTYADKFNELSLYYCGHVGKPLGGYPLFEPFKRDDIVAVTPRHNISGIVSFFRDDEGNDYIALVNISKTESGQLAIALSDSVKGFIRQGTSFGEQDALKYYHDEGMEKIDGYRVFTPWFAPGQLNLYKIVK